LATRIAEPLVDVGRQRRSAALANVADHRDAPRRLHDPPDRHGDSQSADDIRAMVASLHETKVIVWRRETIRQAGTQERTAGWLRRRRAALEALADKAFGSDHPNVAQSLNSFTEIEVATPMRRRWYRRRSRLRAPIRP
jgi:hypothetical protein